MEAEDKARMQSRNQNQWKTKEQTNIMAIRAEVD